MEHIKKRVNELVKRFDTNNPFEIAESLGIVIRFIPLGNVLGFFSKQYRFSFIHINELSSESQQLFACGHELGHAILHPNANTPFLKENTYFSTDQLEIEANMFAIELLFSNSSIQSITLKEATEDYGIPIEMIHKKFYP